MGILTSLMTNIFTSAVMPKKIAPNNTPHSAVTSAASTAAGGELNVSNLIEQLSGSGLIYDPEGQPLTITITSLPSHGAFKQVSVTNSVQTDQNGDPVLDANGNFIDVTTVTYSDVQLTPFTTDNIPQNIVYIHDGGDSTSDSIDVSYSDGVNTSTNTLTITIDQPAPAPFFTAPSAMFDNPSPDDQNTLTASGATEGQLIQGGDDADTITVSDHGDVVIGGYGEDTITLGDGADVVIHRFRSFPDTASDDYINSDGGDVIHNFNVGTDKLLLVDENTSTPLANWEAFIAATENEHGVRFDVITNTLDEITGLKIDIGLQGTVDGEDAGVDAGDTLTINFVTPVANSASDVTNGTVNEASELAFVTQLLGGADYVDVISVDDLSTDYGITIV